MGEIKIDIPKDMEAAFEEAFSGVDKSAAVLRLIEAEIARRQDAQRAGASPAPGTRWPRRATASNQGSKPACFRRQDCAGTRGAEEIMKLQGKSHAAP